MHCVIDIFHNRRTDKDATKPRTLGLLGHSDETLHSPPPLYSNLTTQISFSATASTRIVLLVLVLLVHYTMFFTHPFHSILFHVQKRDCDVYNYFLCTVITKLIRHIAPCRWCGVKAGPLRLK